MASQVISFRLAEDALAKLAEKSKDGESPSQTAQRLLNGLLGTAKEIEITEVDSRIQAALAPLKAELDEIKTALAQQPGKSKRAA
jgi:uncharacterized alpha-E superfamily protein